MARPVFVLLLAVLPIVLGLTVETKKCTDVSDEQCKINEVNITPCTLQRSKCKVKKLQDTEIKFTFTPEFATSDLKTAVYWESGVNDLGFADLDSDACKLTTCPTEAGKQQEYNYSLNLGKKIPDGVFPLKWKLYDAKNETNTCCFRVTVSIRR